MRIFFRHFFFGSVVLGFALWMLIDARMPVITETPKSGEYWPKKLPSCGGTYSVNRTYIRHRDCSTVGVIAWSCINPITGAEIVFGRPQSYDANLSMGVNKKELRDLEAPCGFPPGSVCTQFFEWKSTCWLITKSEPMRPLVFEVTD